MLSRDQRTTPAQGSASSPSPSHRLAGAGPLLGQAACLLPKCHDVPMSICNVALRDMCLPLSPSHHHMPEAPMSCRVWHAYEPPPAVSSPELFHPLLGISPTLTFTFTLLRPCPGPLVSPADQRVHFLAQPASTQHPLSVQRWAPSSPRGPLPQR